MNEKRYCYNNYVCVVNPSNKTYSFTICKLMEQTIKSNTTTDKIDVSNNSKGLYLINLSNEGQSNMFRIILK